MTSAKKQGGVFALEALTMMTSLEPPKEGWCKISRPYIHMPVSKLKTKEKLPNAVSREFIDLKDVWVLWIPANYDAQNRRLAHSLKIVRGKELVSTAVVKNSDKYLEAIERARELSKYVCCGCHKTFPDAVPQIESVGLNSVRICSAPECGKKALASALLNELNGDFK